MLDLITTAVNTATGTRLGSPREEIDALTSGATATMKPRLGTGAVPNNVLFGTQISFGADGETAREVLAKTLAAASVPLSWQIFCDPGTTRICALNVHVVVRREN